MASSMVSPIFNTFAGAAEFYTQEQCGTLMLKATRYGELLAAVLTKLTTIYNGTQSKSETPSKVYGNHVLAELTRFGFDRLCVKCDALQEFESEEFGFILRSQFGKLSQRKKGEFDSSYDIHYTEMEQPLDEIRYLFTLIKALRLYTSELFKRIAGTYDPADFRPSHATYSIEGKKRTSEVFVRYCQQLYDIHFAFCKYSEKLSEFTEFFKTANGLSKTLSDKLKAERESQRHVQKTDKSAKPDGKTGKTGKTDKHKSTSAAAAAPAPKQAVRVFAKAENGEIVQLPTPPPSVWAKRAAEKKEKDEVTAAAKAEETQVDESADDDDVGQAENGDDVGQAADQVPEKEEEFKVVVSKRNKKPEANTSTKGRRFRKE